MKFGNDNVEIYTSTVNRQLPTANCQPAFAKATAGKAVIRQPSTLAYKP
jgi:hypothetical protein